MKKIIFILVLGMSGIVNAQQEYFTGEVYKVEKYAKQIICRGPDLRPIKTDQILYICDENNNLVATVQVTRYYTTIIETKLISGDINLVKAKMPVYSHKSQFEAKKQIKIIKYEKEYDYYYWDVYVDYKIGNNVYTKPSKIMMPRIITLLSAGSENEVKIGDYEIESLNIKNLEIKGIKLKTGEEAEIEKIDFNIEPEMIPEFKVETKLVMKNVKASDAFRIRLIKRAEGYDYEPPPSTSICWEKTYGGSLNDEARSIQQTRDGGYIVAGYTKSKGAGGYDFWVLKLDENGEIIWDKTYGGSRTDEAFSIQQTRDGGYIVAGYTWSKGAGGYDFWVLKLDENGNIK